MTITDAELAINVENNVVRNFTITQTANGMYQMSVELTWRREILTVITARKTVREWVSLDRLISHIQKNYGNLPPITLKLCNIEELNK